MTEKRKRSVLRLPVGSDRSIHLAVMALTLFGLIMVTSATMGTDAANYMSLIKTVFKQLLFTVAGFVGMLYMSRMFTFERCRQLLFLLILGTLGLLVFALFFDPVGGAKAWIRVPVAGMEFTLQPSEFSKISIMLIMAMYLGDVRVQKIESKELVKAPLLLVGLFVGIVVILQSDTGSGVIMLGIAAVLFLIPQHRALRNYQKKLLLLLAGGGGLAVFLMTPVGETVLKHIPIATYQINRFLMAQNPFADRYGDGYQLIKGLISFASGGLTGVGFGASIQKYMNFPAASTDYILAIVVEELGFGGFLFIFFCYMVIFCRLFIYAMKIESERARMVLIGVAMYLFIHYLFNVGGVTGLIPLTGVPLLLISAGGSSTMSFMTSVGIAQAIISQYRQGRIQ